jgi:hypothetical protein
MITRHSNFHNFNAWSKKGRGDGSELQNEAREQRSNKATLCIAEETPYAYIFINYNS